MHDIQEARWEFTSECNVVERSVLASKDPCFVLLVGNWVSYFVRGCRIAQEERAAERINVTKSLTTTDRSLNNWRAKYVYTFVSPCFEGLCTIDQVHFPNLETLCLLDTK